jgi:5-methyltetrahydrofolate--homocysteine methyltransferase
VLFRSGTQLIARGLQPGVCGETWNLERPEAVESIHRAYRQAGCDLVTTNTFGANSTNLERHGLAAQTAVFNLAGAQTARRAADGAIEGLEASRVSGLASRGGGLPINRLTDSPINQSTIPGGWVLGDIGPFGGFLEPLGDMTPGVLLEVFRGQAQALRDGGADAIIIETMVDPAELSIAVKAAKTVANWPVIATYAFNRDQGNSGGGGKLRGFRTVMGTSVQDAMAAAIDAGADVVGANCGTSLSLEDYLRLAEQLVAAAGPSKTPVILQPNAGSPQMIDGKLVHSATPADMAGLVKPLLGIGVRIIGGCCGTSPEHLRAMAGKMPRKG